MFHSPLKSKDQIRDIVVNWLSLNLNDNTDILDYSFNNYVNVNSNRWIFNILNIIHSKQRNIIVEQYFNNIVDITCKINIFDTTISFNTMQEKISKSHMEMEFVLGISLWI